MFNAYYALSRLTWRRVRAEARRFVRVWPLTRLKPDGFNLSETRWSRAETRWSQPYDIKIWNICHDVCYFVFIYPMPRLLPVGSDVLLTGVS